MLLLLYLFSQLPVGETFDPSDSTLYYIEQEVSDFPPLNVNTASYQDLIRLPYISYELAQAILIEAKRKPFKDIYDLTSRVSLTPVEFLVLRSVLVYETRPPTVDIKGFLMGEINEREALVLKFWTIGTYYKKWLFGYRFPEKHWTLGYQDKHMGVYTGFLVPQFGLGLLFPYSYRYYPRHRSSARFKFLRGEELSIGVDLSNTLGVLLWLSRSKKYSLRFHRKRLGLNLSENGLTLDFYQRIGSIWIANEFGFIGSKKFRFISVLRDRVNFGTFNIGITNAGVLGLQLTLRPLKTLRLSLSQSLYSGYSYRRHSLGVSYGNQQDGITIRYYSSGKLPGPYRSTYTLRLRWRSLGINQSVMFIRTVSGRSHGTGILVDILVSELFIHAVVYRAPEWDSRIYLYDPGVGPRTYSRMFYGTGSEITLGYLKRLPNLRIMFKGVVSVKPDTYDAKLVVYIYKV